MGDEPPMTEALIESPEMRQALTELKGLRRPNGAMVLARVLVVHTHSRSSVYSTFDSRLPRCRVDKLNLEDMFETNFNSRL